MIDTSNLIIDKKDKTTITMEGDLGIGRDTKKNLELKIDIFKNVNDQYEYLFNVHVENLCDHVSEKKKPWTPFMEQMRVVACPITKGMYTFKNATLDTAGFPLTEVHQGSYKAKAEILEDGVKVSCMLFLADIICE
uniref:MD-2-related lipid-recognition domain-containing protein n=2 Tax=Clastoptera arizonana TaxID=38151 RepID=A0A1B6BZ40_9HEMI